MRELERVGDSLSENTEHIRLAVPADIPDISRIHALAWKAAYRDVLSEKFLNRLPFDRWIPIFNETLKEGTYKVAVIEAGSEITGCVTFGPARDERFAGDGEIVSLYVLPGHWSRGQGYRLVSFALEELKREGCACCYLWVLRQNSRGIRFYERVGFSAAGEEMTVELDGETLSELRYEIGLT